MRGSLSPWSHKGVDAFSTYPSRSPRMAQALERPEYSTDWGKSVSRTNSPFAFSHPTSRSVSLVRGSPSQSPRQAIHALPFGIAGGFSIVRTRIQADPGSDRPMKAAPAIIRALGGLLRASRACTHKRAGNVGFRGNSGRGLGHRGMSANGTKPTFKPVRRMSAIRGKPDMTQTCLDDRV